MDEQEAAAMKKARPLPQNRAANPEPPSVFLEPDEILPGRISVGQALELLAKHKRNKQVCINAVHLIFSCPFNHFFLLLLCTGCL